MSDVHPNEVPEFAHTDKATRRRELAAAGAKSHEHLDRIKKNLKLSNLVGVETETQSLALIACPEQLTVRLLTGPNQRILKRVVESWSADGVCYRTAYDFGVQFTGYSGYCMSFEKDLKKTDMFGRFFNDVAAYGVNLNRAMLFLKESYANEEHPENCHRLLRDGDPKNTTVTEEYLVNLNRYVDAAKARGIVVQVCLFMHHAVAGTNECDMPKPIMLGATTSPRERYRAFFNTASDYQQTQVNFIRDVVNKLKPHWNVIYEVGNELRVPQPGVDYNETHLRAWVEWVALRIRDYDALHLIGTSTGAANESLINSIPLLQYCSFHQDQWTQNIAAACVRAAGYNNKHLIADDDGGSRELQNVRTWVRAAFDVGGGCRGSFNHKGNTMFNEYDPQWLDKYNPKAPQSWGKPREVLEAFRDARRNTSSPCARTG